jgi:hypothetical protein
MGYQENILRQIADRHCDRICRLTIRALQQIRDCGLSGDASGLKNTWDEICVQMQSEESFAWDAYVQTIKATIAYEVERLPRPEQEAIWIRTPQGIDWEGELEDTPSSVPICLDDITDCILQDYVLSKASDYTNKRIEKYLEQGYELG